MTQFWRTQCILYISPSLSFSAVLLVFVCSIFICDQRLSLAHWVGPVPRPVGIIRFGNAENKSMLIPIHMHTHAHAQYILDYANHWLMLPLKCTEWGWRRVAAEINRVHMEDAENKLNFTWCRRIFLKVLCLNKSHLLIEFFLIFLSQYIRVMF